MSDMIKVKTSELIGPALDWAVGVADKGDWVPHESGMGQWRDSMGNLYFLGYSPSADWGHGGPLMEANDWMLPRRASGHRHHLGQYEANTPGGFPYNGPTPLVAAFRAFVAASLGDEVEIPVELAGPVQ